MFGVSKAYLEYLRSQYPKGCRVELVQMDDPYSRLTPGERGTVVAVDDMGTIHVRWDCGSNLGLVLGEDVCKKIS